MKPKIKQIFWTIFWGFAPLGMYLVTKRYGVDVAVCVFAGIGAAMMAYTCPIWIKWQ